MRKKAALIFGALILVVSVVVLWLLSKDATMAVLEPKGAIATQQKDLILLATALSLLIILPVFALTFWIVWKYHAGSKGAKYTPNADGNKWAEALWWGIPLALIAVLSGIIWTSSHQLDPYRPLVSDKKPIRIQVIALQWKWLFLYPDQKIASVNYLQIPVDTPINFEVTSDAPMNSLWIPQLGGQVYAMSGMTTKLHLMANEPGLYDGKTANISGTGHASMTFKVGAGSDGEFKRWVSDAQTKHQPLTTQKYDQLAIPSEKNPVTIYSEYPRDLYHSVVMKYMTPDKAEGMTHDTKTHE